MDLRIKCLLCNNVYILKVFAINYNDWKCGRKAQDAFPYLTPGERELIISKTCENCFNMLTEEEEK
jgi:hypothetical protein